MSLLFNMLGLVPLSEETLKSSLSTVWGLSEKVTICNTKRERSPDPDRAGTLILDFTVHICG